MRRSSKDREPDRALSLQPPARRVVRRYHVALTPAEVLEQLTELPGVKAYRARTMPELGGIADNSEYTLELGTDEFTLHCGQPAARGQSATGMLRVLYLRGRMTRTEEGTLIELSFAQRRPRWALQRWVGFLALASLGLLWVFIGPGEIAKKAMLYGLLLLVLGPVVVHDLRRGEQLEEHRKALLNLVEGSFGPIELDEPHPHEPYRRRMIASASTSAEGPRVDHDQDDDDDDDEEDEDDIA